MAWQDLLEHSDVRLVTPWLGGRRIHREGRTWCVSGALPREYGWYEWEIQGRTARLVGPHEMDFDYMAGPWDRRRDRGYLVGNRMVLAATGAGVVLDDFRQHTVPVFLVEPGLERFAFAEIGYVAPDQAIYRQELFPSGSEDPVRNAFIDRKASIDDIAGVGPALDLAFRFAVHQRQRSEERRAELGRLRAEERRREELARNIGTSLSRRAATAHNFEGAARTALSMGGAELLDTRPGRAHREMVVQYLLQNRRFECVVERDTLRIVDSGICLTDSGTGEKGDTYFTLESLPSVVSQAIREGELHVYRHVED